MINKGKVFEQNFKLSVPKEILYERFKDGTAGWNQYDNNVRFQSQNVCDCFLFDGSILLYLELKSHTGKSLPITCIRKNQLEELPKRQMYKNCISGILVEFRDVERTFYLNIKDLLDFLKESDRKSVPLEYFVERGIEVEMIKLRTNYRYNVKKMYEDIINSDL